MEPWVKKKKKQEAGNQFHRLPDDVVVHIFNKLSDVTWLCRCFVVSKRFSSLVPRVQTVSFRSKIWNSVLNSCSVSRKFEERNSKRKFSEISLKPLGCLKNLPPSPPSRLNFFPDFAFHLKQIQSLNIELPFDEFIGNKDSVLEYWGAKFTTKLNRFTVLYATSLSKMVKSEGEEEDNDGVKENGITRREITRRVNLAVEYVRDAMCLVVILFRIIPKYPMLRRISITDSKNKRVKLCLGGGNFVGCRNTLDKCSMILSKRAEGWTMNKKGGGYVPVLRLPNSGYVMKGVTTANYMGGYSGKSERLLKAFGGNDSEAETLTLDAFAEEEGVFSEAMVQIQGKRKDVIKAFF
ncbi:hypothetical protein RHSIM_Rhsim13G0213800 [Rhododendron simsii]|uniref:F-box domain-containing protein n=1 Tax=Rhododendron simsii TaxID=118357 RepID=A0A834G0Q9_RHOSS|nr:hypothetical protein RHSIM_Rhsim13G0213800 [Rhododendron simsii]